MKCQFEGCRRRAGLYSYGYCEKHWEEVRYKGEDDNAPEENTGQFPW